jgi:hypothetical protein
MKKYTKKQIYEAFLKWDTELRLNPEGFLSREEQIKLSVEEASRKTTEAFIEYLNK